MFGAAVANSRARAIFAVLFGLVAGVVVYFYTEYRRFADAPLAPLATATSIDVPLGTSLPGVLRALDASDIHSGQPLYWRVLARELGVAGKCGGRTLNRDVIDDTLGAVVGPGVSDNVSNDNMANLTDFPFLADPN